MKSLAKWAACVLLVLPMTACDQPAELVPQEQPDAAGTAPPIALSGWVVNQAGLVRPEIERGLTHNLEQLARDVGPQFVIVTVNSLGGKPIEEYAQRLGNCWGLGSETDKDGLLLLVAPREGRARIEVGLGLEAVLTDEYASDVMAKQILPHFERGNMEEGIRQGASALIQKLRASQDRIYAQPPADGQGLTCND